MFKVYCDAEYGMPDYKSGGYETQMVNIYTCFDWPRVQQRRCDVITILVPTNMQTRGVNLA